MMADQTLFNGLYTYAMAAPDSNGLMKWTCPGGTGCTGNAATDADQDIAMALLMGGVQWNNTTYTTAGTTMCKNVFAHDIVSNVVTGGDANTGVVYPDYCMPAWYRCFATVDTADGWANVTTWVYNTLHPALHSQWGYGFIPNEVSNDGTFHSAISVGGEAALNHGYDASRFGYRIGVDALWNGTNAPITDFANAIQAGVTGTTYGSWANFVEEYWNVSNGQPCTQNGAGTGPPWSSLAHRFRWARWWWHACRWPITPRTRLS